MVATMPGRVSALKPAQETCLFLHMSNMSYSGTGGARGSYGPENSIPISLAGRIREADARRADAIPSPGDDGHPAEVGPNPRGDCGNEQDREGNKALGCATTRVVERLRADGSSGPITIIAGPPSRYAR